MTRDNKAKLKKAFLGHGFKYVKLELEAEIGIDDCHEDFQDAFVERLPKVLQKNIKYIECYNDGSVDCEITMTFRVNYLHYSAKIMEAFKVTCLEYSNSAFETERAGLHITLLEGYQYPRRQKLPTVKILNFINETNKLMLALSFLAFPNVDFTRGFEYRQLRTSDTNKYSAIFTHQNTCLEFRVFDTCYDTPEDIFSYYTTIVKMLRFYTEDSTKQVFERELDYSERDRLMNAELDCQYWNKKTIFNKLRGHKRLYKELIYLTNGKTKKQLEEALKFRKLSDSWTFFNTIKKQLCVG